MTDNDNIITITPRAAAFDIVANLLAAIDDSDLRQFLADSIIEYGASCAQQVLDSWTRSIDDLQQSRRPQVESD